MYANDPSLWWTAFGAIAQALGAAATFAAVAVSLWVVLSERSIKAEGSAQIKIIYIGDGSPGLYVATVEVTNTGLRPFRIRSVGWRSGWVSITLKRLMLKPLAHRYAMQLDGAPPFELALPRLVEPTASARFRIPVRDMKNVKAEARRELFSRSLPILGSAPIHAVVSIDGRKDLLIKVAGDLAVFLRTGDYPDTTDEKKSGGSASSWMA